MAFVLDYEERNKAASLNSGSPWGKKFLQHNSTEGVIPRTVNKKYQN